MSEELLEDKNNEIEDLFGIGCNSIILEKSKLRYEATYTTFKKWCEEKHVSVCEKVLVAYFVQCNTKLKCPGGLWAEYSMLKSTINLNDDIDISKYTKLITFLKSKNAGYQPKKSNVFSREDMNTFLTEAPDNEFLLMKVVFIMGVAGASRRQELCDLTIDDIEDRGSLVVVKIPMTKTGIQRSFTITNHRNEEVHFLEIFRKYASLRPQRVDSRRFFLKYHNGRCFNQVVGRNTIGSFPIKIATYLKKENPKSFTGHSFRRTSATLLANKGVDVLELKRHRGWKSSSVAESYVEESLENKIQFADNILHNRNMSVNFVQQPTTSSSSIPEKSEHNSVLNNATVINNTNNSFATRLEGNKILFIFNNHASSCTINFNINN